MNIGDNQLTIKWDPSIHQFTVSTWIDGIEYLAIGGSPTEAYENFKKEYTE